MSFREVQIGPCKLANADCRDVLSLIEQDSVDTIITDPPYGLSFMGKEWDHGVPGVQFWEAALRVAKPGAILMAFGGTRTFHRLACAIEDAGWELRDTIMWVYGTGFPKSLDISKAIDKASGAERVVVGKKGGRYTTPINDMRGGKLVGSDKSVDLGVITAPATDAAKAWSGYGTALKPAWEPIIVAMKPLDGTFAENASKHGVAGLDIDGGRIDVNGESVPVFMSEGGRKFEQSHTQPNKTTRQVGVSTIGRFPANLIHDGSDEVMAGFPEANSARSSGNPNNPKRGTNHMASSYGQGDGKVTHDVRDKGSAARFFYCAKASSSERGDFNTHPTVKPLALMEYLCKLTKTPTGGVVIDMFMGSGSTGVACVNTGRNFIGVDSDVEHGYFDIACQRIQRAWDLKCSELPFEKPTPPRQLSLIE